MLWTRAVLTSGATDPVSLTVEVATDADFENVVVTQEIEATETTDHTVRVVIDELTANTVYYYRFVAGSDIVSGRTYTAPPADADIPIRLAWVSCQDYTAGNFGAYRLLLEEDDERDEADRIRFVLHLGDFIYETRGDYFQKPLGDDFEPIAPLRNADDTVRDVAEFPSGGGSTGDHNFARTVDDYRHLYKRFASDPDLRAARARWPFIHTWDDHEFGNDCWQSQANYDDDESTDEGAQSRKLAANQAWFEYIPAQLTGATGVAGVTQHAKDFATATVIDAEFTPPDDDNFVDEENNVAAIGSLTIYRSLRFGRHVELVVTDQRSYRSDHAIPEEFGANNIWYLDPRNVLPADQLAIMDAGRDANDGDPPATVGNQNLPNPRLESPPGTMLGATQKAWFKATMTESDATWKVWANEVPLMRFLIPREPIGALFTDRIMNGDAWDGYATERTELTTHFRENEINLVVLTGDIHAHFAGQVYDDYLSQAPAPVGVELCAAGIASNSLFSFYEYASRGSSIPPDLRSVITYDASDSGGSPFVENLNMLLLHGTPAARAVATGTSISDAIDASSSPNPHLKYADTNAQGYGVALITATEIEATLTTVERPISSDFAVKRTASFTIPKDNPGGMSDPLVTGTKPFPMT